jgi:hypothetical protein
VCINPLKENHNNNNNNNNQFFDDQVTNESIHRALNAAATNHHCVRRCQKKPVLVWYTLTASTLIALFVEMLKLSPKK